MDLKVRSTKSILIKYIVITFLLWGGIIGILGGVFWLASVQDNGFAESLLPLLFMGFILSPFFIPSKSARMALNDLAILPREKHLKKLWLTVALVNIMIYSLPFLFLLWIVDHHLLWLTGLIVINLIAFLSTFWKFRPLRKTKLTDQVQVMAHEIIKSDDDFYIHDIDLTKIPDFNIYPTRKEIKQIYDKILPISFGISFLGAILGPLFDHLFPFLALIFLAPIGAFGIIFYRLNYFQFKKAPLPFQVVFGHKLTALIFMMNLIHYLIFAGLSTAVIVLMLSDSQRCLTVSQWLFIIALVWLFFTLSFLPLFFVSHLYFKNLEKSASAANRIAEHLPFYSQRLTLKGKKTDDSIQAFLNDIGLKEMNYLVGIRAFNMNIDDLGHPSTPPTLMAYNDHMVHIFSFYIGAKRINYQLSFPTSALTVLKTLNSGSQRRVDFLVGRHLRILFIADTQEKHFINQEAMFDGFLNLNQRREHDESITP